MLPKENTEELCIVQWLLLRQRGPGIHPLHASKMNPKYCSEPCVESSVPHADHLIETGTDMIKLQMGSWVDANCPTDHLTVQGRIKGEVEWSSAASRVEPGASPFTLRYLTPSTWFHVKVVLSTKKSSLSQVTGIPERSSANSTT